MTLGDALGESNMFVALVSFLNLRIAQASGKHDFHPFRNRLILEREMWRCVLAGTGTGTCFRGLCCSLLVISLFCSCQESSSKRLKSSVFFKPFPSRLRDLCRRGGGKIISDSDGG